MKKLLLILICFISLSANAQLDVKPNYTKPFFQGSVKIADTLGVGNNDLFVRSGFVGVGVGASVPLFGEKLRVVGNFVTSANAAFGGSVLLGNTIRAPDGWRFLAGGRTSLIDNTIENFTEIGTRNSKLVLSSNDNTNHYFEAYQSNAKTTISIKAVHPSIGAKIKNTGIIFNSRYYNDTDIYKLSEINHNVTNDLSGASQLDFSISGVNLVSIKDNGGTALEVNSTTSGFLPPRMTTAQRDAIVSPATGLQVYNTTTNTPQFYNGSVWGNI